MKQQISDTAAPAEPLRLGQLLARLDEIRRDLDREDLDLEEQLELYREGCGHVLRAKQILNQVRAEVDLLMSDVDAVETRGLDPA